MMIKLIQALFVFFVVVLMVCVCVGLVGKCSGDYISELQSYGSY